MTTIEILKKELPECIWKRIVRYNYREIDPGYYYVHDLLDLIDWEGTQEGRWFWYQLHNLYCISPKTPSTSSIERVFRKHGIPLEVPSGEA